MTVAGLLLTIFSSPVFGEITKPQILAKPIGVIKVQPLHLLECVAIWTNYWGARLEFRGLVIRGGYGLGQLSLGQHEWRPFLGALKRAKASSSNLHARWEYSEKSYRRELYDPIDVKTVVTPAGAYYELTLHSDAKRHDTQEKIVYQLNAKQLDEVIGWMESALQQVHEWPKADRNPWGDTSSDTPRFQKTVPF